MVFVNSLPLALLVAFVAVAELPVHEPDEPLTLPVTLPVRRYSPRTWIDLNS